MSKPKTQCSTTPPHTPVSQLHSPCSVFVIPCGRSGSTPFLASCYDGRIDICKVLFESGADIAAKDDRYNTHSFFSFKHSISAPFSIYVILYYTETLQLFTNVAMKATSKYANSLLREGQTWRQRPGEDALRKQLAVAVSKTHPLRCRYGRTPLTHAIDRGHSDIVAFLRSIDAPEH